MVAAVSLPPLSIEPALEVVRARAGEAERIRRIPDDVVAALRGTGLNRAVLPTALGGREGPVLDLMEAVERIAAVDGSTGWNAIIGSASNVFAGYMSEAGAREVFADPDQGSATMLALAGRITRRGATTVLDGRWPFTSNCLHSTWIGLGALVEPDAGADGTEPVPTTVFVRAGDLEIEDTWDSQGLRGTGSHHVTAHGVPVELGRAAPAGGPSWADGTLWRLPIHTVLLPALTSVPLGIARGAVDEVVRLAQEGRDARRGQIADDPIGLADLGMADTRLRAARAALREAVAVAHEAAVRGEPVPPPLQARIYLACHHATETSVEVTGVAHRLGGGAAAYAGSPLLRALADVEAARQHLLFSHQHRPALTQALLGMPVVQPPFFR
jgi:alkylation response protein AidB-like acyl-CoA dehydrogenase